MNMVDTAIKIYFIMFIGLAAGVLLLIALSVTALGIQQLKRSTKQDLMDWSFTLIRTGVLAVVCYLVGLGTMNLLGCPWK